MKAGTHIADELAEHVSRATVIRRNESLAKHTTLRVAARRTFMLKPASEEDLAGVRKILQRARPAVFRDGRGSNLLVRDGGVRAW